MTVADDRALMDEEVLRAVIGGDEAEALLVVEPLHCSCSHVNSSTGLVRRARRMRVRQRLRTALFAPRGCVAEATLARFGSDSARIARSRRFARTLAAPQAG